VHGGDIVSTFYNGQGNVVSEGSIEQVAQGLQGYIVNFAKTGNPNGKGLPSFPKYGSGSTELELNYTGFKAQVDPSANARCDWWQKGCGFDASGWARQNLRDLLVTQST